MAIRSSIRLYVVTARRMDSSVPNEVRVLSSVTQSDAKNAAAAAAELQEQVDEMTAQIDELNSRLEQAAQSGADAGSAGPMVYVTPSGSRYHNEGCQYIGKRAVQMPLADAKEAGYTACAKCE